MVRSTARTRTLILTGMMNVTILLILAMIHESHFVQVIVRVESKVHEGIDMNESEPNITRRRLVTHPSRICNIGSSCSIKSFSSRNPSTPQIN